MEYLSEPIESEEYEYGLCGCCKKPLKLCEPHFQGGVYCDNPNCEECV